MWKTILSLAALVLSVGVSAHLIGTANATLGSSVSLGSNPIRNFGGVIPTSSQTLIFTAPEDQDYVVTGMLSNDGCAIVVGDTTILPETGYFYPTMVYSRTDRSVTLQPSMFTTGRATLRIPAGETLSLDCIGSSNRYYIQGYLAQP